MTTPGATTKPAAPPAKLATGQICRGPFAVETIRFLHGLYGYYAACRVPGAAPGRSVV
jgi:hypothetical protein